MNIIAYLPNAADATSYYRGAGPLNMMDRMYGDVNVRYARPHDFSWDTMLWADVIFVQRPSHPHQLEIMQRAKSMGTARLWVDFDDNHLALPAYHSRISEQDSINHITMMAIQTCDLLTLSTSELQGFWKPYLDEVHVEIVPNAMWHDPSDQWNESSNVIIIRTSQSASNDIDWIKWKPIHDQIIAQGYEIVYIGHTPDYADNPIDWMPDLWSYFAMIRKLRPRLIIKPMYHLDDFNMCRSATAMLEATFAGAVSIGPDTSDFRAGMIYINMKEILDLMKVNPGTLKAVFNNQRIEYANRRFKMISRRYNILSKLL